MIKPGFRTRTWTYRDLEDIVPRTARYLSESGIQKGDRVITFGVNRPEYGIAMLAALRVGAVLVPLDVNSSAEFVQKIATLTRASAAVVSQQTRPRAEGLGLTLFDMEQLPDRARLKEPLPKAAVRSLFIAIERRAQQEGKGELFARLRRIARKLPMALRRLLFFTVHSQFGGRFRYIVSGGAALDPALGEAWRELGVDVLQGHGLTETSPALTFNRLDRNRLGSVGVPLPGVLVKITDEGEVIAHGPNIFKGYWENEEATRAAIDKDGWFHTGDLGKFDADGFLWLHGRKKDMIALPDGLKVYPEDIENILAADPRLQKIATPHRPLLAPVAGLPRPCATLQVHAVFLEPKDPAAVAQIGRETNAKLSGSQQIRGWSIWPDPEFPTTPKQSVRKREIVEALLRTASGGAAPATPSPSTQE